MAESLYATITVKYLNPPKGNARSWSIKDAEGNYWGLTPILAKSVVQGSTIEIMYEERSTPTGTVFKDIKDIRPAAPAAVAAAAVAGDEKGRDIFLTGVVQQAMATGQFVADDIGPLTKAAAQAWDEAHGTRRATNGATNGNGATAGNGGAAKSHAQDPFPGTSTNGHARGAWRGAQA